MLEEMVARYGFRDRMVSIRTTPLYVLDVEKDPARALRMLSAEARKAKDEDDAEAILLGCAGFAQFAQELEEDLHIPVLDGVVCAVKMAEAIAELGKTTSKHKTYRPPERKVFSGMLEKFGRS
jgi:allantoin racemase